MHYNVVVNCCLSIIIFESSVIVFCVYELGGRSTGGATNMASS